MDILINMLRWADNRDVKKSRGKVVSAKDPQEYLDKLALAIEKVAWFGEQHFPPTLRKKPPRGVAFDLPYIRRILISWLVGRPVSDIAARAGCSPRLVHNIVRGAIYDPEEPILEYWRDLGLIAVLDGPRAKFSWRTWANFTDYSSDAPEPSKLLIICQICHRPAGMLEYDSEFRAFDCRTIEAEEWQWQNLMWIESPEVQGHLICHFFLEDNPIRLPRKRPLDDLVEVIGTPEKVAEVKRRRAARSRVHWSTFAESKTLDVIDDWEEQGQPALLPIRDGAEMSPTAAERHWLALLSRE